MRGFKWLPKIGRIFHHDFSASKQHSTHRTEEHRGEAQRHNRHGDGEPSELPVPFPRDLHQQAHRHEDFHDDNARLAAQSHRKHPAFLRSRRLEAASHALHHHNLQSVVDPHEQEGEFPVPGDDSVVLRSHQIDGECDNHVRELVEEVLELVLPFVGIQKRHVEIFESVDEVGNEGCREIHLPNPVETEHEADLRHHKDDDIDVHEKRISNRKTLLFIQRFVFLHFCKKNGEGADAHVEQKRVHDKSRQHYYPPWPSYPFIDPHAQCQNEPYRSQKQKQKERKN